MRIKLMPDFGCWPLWTVGSEADNIDPQQLPLSAETIKKLGTWAVAYNDTLNQEYPPDSNFKSEQDRTNFNLLGRELLQAIRRELGPEYDVIYSNHYDKEFKG